MAFTLNNDYSPHASDDISLFLRQLLNNCSSSSSDISLAHSGQLNVGVSSSLAEAVPNNLGHLAGRSTIKVFDYRRPLLDPTASPDSQTCCYPNDALSDTLWTEIPTADDYACDSDVHSFPISNCAQEGLEPVKQNQVRNSSKRTRAAQVHNMSEKRRRSRINEKMKALQNLIPNSNKTDKASMLDDAIEYLKQLQLQVQMLLVRHGLILHPMSLPGIPGVFDPVQIPQMGFNFSNVEQCDPLANQQLDGLAGGITEQAPFSLQSPMDNQIGSFHLPASSQSFCGDDTMAQHQLSTLASQTTPLESMKPMLSSVSKYSSLSQGVLLTNCTSHVQLISSNLDGLCPGTTAPDDILDRKVGWKSEPGKLMF